LPVYLDDSGERYLKEVCRLASVLRRKPSGALSAKVGRQNIYPIFGGAGAMEGKLKILIACEFSGVVREAFKAQGHDAWSCDLLPTEIPGNHIQGDVLGILDDGWDLMVAHPPCTYLASSGLHWNKRRPGRSLLTEEALDFVQALHEAPIRHIAIENPVGCISTRLRKPDQIIQPYEFGGNASKATCLWLINLPALTPTRIIEPEYACKCGNRFSNELGKYGCFNCDGIAKPVWGNQTGSGQNKVAPSPDRWKERSRTFPGITEAMATQWGCLSLTEPIPQLMAQRVFEQFDF
jgi:hypothetical protein